MWVIYATHGRTALASYVVFSNNILVFVWEWGDCIWSVANMVHINIQASKSKPRCITVIHHMLESHHCPFGTAEAPCGFNRAKLQNPIQGHTKIPLSIHSSIHWRLYLVCLQSASVCWPYILSMQTVYCVFPPGFLIVALGQDEDFTQSQSGRKSRDLVRLHGKNRSWGWIELHEPGLGMWW